MKAPWQLLSSGVVKRTESDRFGEGRGPIISVIILFSESHPEAVS